MVEEATPSEGKGSTTSKEKKMAAKKTAAKKATTKKATTKSKTARVKKPVSTMTPEVKELAGYILGAATDKAMSSDTLGVVKTTSSALAGARAESGMRTVIVLDDGKRVTVTVVQAQRAPKKPRAGKRSRKAETTEES